MSVLVAEVARVRTKLNGVPNSGEFSFELRAAGFYGPVDGYVQVPAGGHPGSSSVDAPLPPSTRCKRTPLTIAVPRRNWLQNVTGSNGGLVSAVEVWMTSYSIANTLFRRDRTGG